MSSLVAWFLSQLSGAHQSIVLDLLKQRDARIAELVAEVNALTEKLEAS